MKKWLIIPALLVVVALVWILTQRGNANIAEPAFSPQIDVIKRGDIRVEVSSTGIIEPINKVEIKSKASGQIVEMTINEADFVKKGDLIARLDPRDTRNAYDLAVADLNVAQATVEQRESDFERSKELFDKGLISAADFDKSRLALTEARAQVVRAKINVNNADIRLKETIVRSPISGVILTKEVEVGQIISSGISSFTGGTLIATVADMSEVYVKADVDEVDIGKIKPGMKARVIADAFPNEVFYGQVIRIAAQAKVVQNVTSFEVTIKVKNPSGKLKAGMNASVDILVADKKNVLLVPNEALMSQKELQQELRKIILATQTVEGASTAKKAKTHNPANKRKKPQQLFTATDSANLARGVILKKGNNYRAKLIKVGASNFDYTEVLEGLKEGDLVAYTYLSRAKMSSEAFKNRIKRFSSMRSGFKNTKK